MRATLFLLVEVKRRLGWNAYLKLCARETLFFNVQQRTCAEAGKGERSRSDREAKSGKEKNKKEMGNHRFILFSKVVNGP